jgi:hypothetical protein
MTKVTANSTPTKNSECIIDELMRYCSLDKENLDNQPESNDIVIGCNSMEKEVEKEQKKEEVEVIYSNSNKICDLNEIFGKEEDRCVISDSLCIYCFKVVKNVVNDYRKRNNIEINENIFKNDCYLDNKLINILKNAQKILEIKKSEIIHVLILFSKLYSEHGNNRSFKGNSYVDIIFYFVTLMMISNKYSSDHPFQNSVWHTLNNLSLQTLQQCELHVLDLLSFRVSVEKNEYQAFKDKYLVSF